MSLKVITTDCSGLIDNWQRSVPSTNGILPRGTTTIELWRKIQWNTCYQMLRWHLDFTKFNFGQGSVPDPAGGAYDAPPNLTGGWGGDTSFPFPTPSTLKAPRSRRQGRRKLSAFSTFGTEPVWTPSCQKLAPRLNLPQLCTSAFYRTNILYDIGILPLVFIDT